MLQTNNNQKSVSLALITFQKLLSIKGKLFGTQVIIIEQWDEFLTCGMWPIL